MITEEQKRLYFIPCRVSTPIGMTIISEVGSSYAEALEKVLREHPEVTAYKEPIEGGNKFGDWIERDE